MQKQQIKIGTQIHSLDYGTIVVLELREKYAVGILLSKLGRNVGQAFFYYSDLENPHVAEKIWLEQPEQPEPEPGKIGWVDASEQQPEPTPNPPSFWDAAGGVSGNVLVWADGFNAPRIGRYFHALKLWKVEGIDTLSNGYPVTHWANFNDPNPTAKRIAPEPEPKEVRCQSCGCINSISYPTEKPKNIFPAKCLSCKQALPVKVPFIYAANDPYNIFSPVEMDNPIAKNEQQNNATVGPEANDEWLAGRWVDGTEKAPEKANAEGELDSAICNACKLPYRKESVIKFYGPESMPVYRGCCSQYCASKCNNQ